MKEVLKFLILLIPVICLSQKEFEFDYSIEYAYNNYKDSTKSKKLYLTNSKDNSYNLILNLTDSLKSELVFKQHDGIYFKALKNLNVVDKELIQFQCADLQNYVKYTNPYKFQVSNYKYINLKDTLINNKIYSRYQLESTKKEKFKTQKNIGTNEYIIDPSTKYHLPILTHMTAYEVWNIRGNIPFGIFKEKIFIDQTGKVLERTSFLKIEKIKLKMELPKKCNFVND